MRNSIIIISFIFFTSCGSSNIIFSPEMCASKGVWSTDYSKVEEQHLIKQKGYTFNISKRVWTPFGILGTKKIYLRDMLESSDIKCEDIYSIDYTVSGDWLDAIRSFIPFMASKTVKVSGSLDEITRTREYKELIRDNKIIIYED